MELPAGRWIIRADGQWADQHRPAGTEGSWVDVPKCSGMLLLRRRDEPPELEGQEPDPPEEEIPVMGGEDPEALTPEEAPAEPAEPEAAEAPAPETVEPELTEPQ